MNIQERWWIVPVVIGVAGLLAFFLAAQFVSVYAPYVLILVLALLGASFLWSFTRGDIWWAVAPAVVAFALAIAVLVNLFLPRNNGWMATLILGASAFVIAAIPNRRVEINVAHFIAILILLFGFVISPLRILWKIVFIVVSLLLAAYFAWLDRDDMKRLFAS